MLPNADYSCCKKAKGRRHDCDRLKVAEISKLMIKANIAALINYIEHKIVLTLNDSLRRDQLPVTEVDIKNHHDIISRYVEPSSLGTIA